MKKTFALLGVCAALGAFCVSAPVQAAPVVDENITWGENIIWGGVTTEQAIWGDVVIPAGTLIGYSVASENSVYVWAWLPGASAPVIIGEQAIWGN